MVIRTSAAPPVGRERSAMANGMQPSGPVVPTGGSDQAGSEPRAAVWSVRAQGDIDIDHASALAGQLDDVVERGAKVVMLDLSGATFLDSSGLRVIVRAGDRLREHDGQLIIEGASGAVSRVLEVTGLLEHYAAPDDGGRDRSS
jgi:anti-sigma B factor antagonist